MFYVYDFLLRFTLFYLYTLSLAMLNSLLVLFIGESEWPKRENAFIIILCLNNFLDPYPHPKKLTNKTTTTTTTTNKIEKRSLKKIIMRYENCGGCLRPFRETSCWDSERQTSNSENEVHLSWPHDMTLLPFPFCLSPFPLILHCVHHCQHHFGINLPFVLLWESECRKGLNGLLVATLSKDCDIVVFGPDVIFLVGSSSSAIPESVTQMKTVMRYYDVIYQRETDK